MYLWVLFTSEGQMEPENDRCIDVVGLLDCCGKVRAESKDKDLDLLVFPLSPMVTNFGS